VRTCGTVLVIAVMAAVLIGVHVSEASLSHGELDTVYLPTYDLMALPILIAGSVLPRPWIPFAGILAAGGFLADFLVLERPGGDLVRWLSFEGPIPLVARTLALPILVTVVAFLWGTRLQRLLHDKLIAQSQADAELTRRAVEEQRRYMADDFKNGVQQLAARMLQGYSTPDQARILLTHADNPYRGSAQFVEHVIHRLGKALSDERRRADAAEQRAGQLAAQLGGMAPRPGMLQQQTGPLPHDVPRNPPAPSRMSAADLVDPNMLRAFGGQSQPERPSNDPTTPWPHRL